MRNKKMLNKFKASIVCMCMFSQAFGVTRSTTSETKSKKYGIMDELKTSLKKDAPIWLVGGGAMTGLALLCIRCIPHNENLEKTDTNAGSSGNSNQTSPPSMSSDGSSRQMPPPNHETSQYKVDHSKLNDCQQLDDIQRKIYGCINSLKNSLVTHNIDSFRWKYFENSIDQNIERIFVAMSKYFANEDKSNQISEIKRLINEFIMVMAKKDRSWEYCSLDNQADEKVALGVAIEIGFKYIIRLVYIRLSEITFKKGKSYNQNQKNILDRLNDMTDFNSILNFIDDKVYNIDLIVHDFQKVCGDYKKLLETGKIN